MVVVAASDAPAVERTHAGLAVTNGNCQREQLWIPHVTRPLAHIRESKGALRRKATVASLCTGLGPESRLPHALGVPMDFAFTSDCKESAYQWILRNGPDSECHFVDLRHLMDSGTGICAKHGFQRCSITRWKKKLDLLIAGISCRPYSNARAERKSGTAQHQDAYLFDAFVKIMVILEPGAALFENVFGISLPESRSDPVSPLQRMLDRIKTDLPMYSVTYFVTNGSLFLVWSRRRIWIFLYAQGEGWGCIPCC